MKTLYQRRMYADGDWNMDDVEKTLGGVFMSSSLPTIEGEHALFAICSVMNHGCYESININLRWSTEEQVMVARATKTIHQYDELLHCYDHNIQSTDVVDRRNKLLKDYGFNCLCETCLEEEGAFDVSEQLNSQGKDEENDNDSD